MEKQQPADPRWEGLDEDLEKLSGGETTDWYGSSVVGGGLVSIEAAAVREIILKNAIDQQVDDENRLSVGEAVKGLPPCLRAKKSF